MSPVPATNLYALGSDSTEHERLIRQAAWLAPHTERFLRGAGMSRGQRVLDLGSGVGDVAIIAAGIVGSTGEVVGAERDPRAVVRATARMREMGLSQVHFTQVDIADLPPDRPFDGIVGRYILMFLGDPVAALRAASRLVRSGGFLAFEEPCWKDFLSACEELPLWRTAADLMVQTFEQTGTNTRMGPELAAVFVRAGLPTAQSRTDRLEGAERWMPDTIRSLAPQMRTLGLPIDSIGDLETLHERLLEEVASQSRAAPLPSIVGAWAHKPT